MTLLPPKSDIAGAWKLWVGPPREFSVEQRLYHSMCLLVVPVMVVFALVNIHMELWPSAQISLAVMVIELLLYAVSRWKGWFIPSLVGNGILSYVALGLNYQVNSGAEGPTLLLFFLTFQLLITATPRRLHMVWVVGHIAVVGLLLYLDAGHPDWARDTYNNRTERLADQYLTYGIVLALGYFLTRFLARHYRQEHKLADRQAELVRRQNAELRRSEAELQAFFQNAVHSHLLLDKSLQVVTYNRAAETLFRHLRGFQLSPGARFLDAFNEEEAKKLEKMCREALRDDQNDLDIAIPLAKGGVAWWRFTLGPAYQDDGDLIGIVFSAVSIQGKVEQEARTQSQDPKLLQIANLHAHALTGPTVSIMSMIRLAKEQGYQITPEDLDLLWEAAEDLEQRVRELITLTSGKSPKAKA
jgi:PAS domain-containing protein